MEKVISAAPIKCILAMVLRHPAADLAPFSDVLGLEIARMWRAGELRNPVEAPVFHCPDSYLETPQNAPGAVEHAVEELSCVWSARPDRCRRLPGAAVRAS